MVDESQARRGVGLVIGVGRYAHDTIPSLKHAVDDAEALVHLLTDQSVCAFSCDSVVQLTDAAANRDAVVKHLSEWLPAHSRNAEIVVIYFAGHGLTHVMGKKEEGYLLLHDTDPDNPVARGVAMSDLAKWVTGLSSSTVVVCLDCCHAGMALPAHRGVGPVRRDLAISPAAVQEMAGKGRFLMVACDEGQKAVEVPELGHGLFTYHLLRGIEGEGDRDNDGRVGLAELFEYVAEAVRRDARRHGSEQVPRTTMYAVGGEYISRARPRRYEPHTHTTGPRIRMEDGPVAAAEELRCRMLGADEPALVHLLRQARRLTDPAAVPLVVPFVVPLLAHGAESVREEAKQVVVAIGVERAFATIEELARSDDAALGPILDGLAAYEARPDLVELLGRVADRATGALLEKATALHDRKRLKLGLETIASRFRAHHSPYKLTGVLGQGPFTVAYDGEHGTSRMRVVVRVLREEFVPQQELRRQFLDVAKQMFCDGHHQHLVRTLDMGSIPEHRLYYVVRSYVDGVTLQNMLTGGHRFEPLQVVELLRQSLSGLSGLHEAGVCHGGLRPSNIFICRGNRVTLGDLTPAHATGRDPRRAYNYRYTAPEILGEEAVGPPADLYALGCVAYELFCGVAPFPSDKLNALLLGHLGGTVRPVRAHRPELASEIDEYLSKLLARDPAARWGAAAALAELEALQLALTRPKPVVGPPPPPPKPGVGAGEGSSAAPLVRDEALARFRPAKTMMTLGGEPVPAAPESVPNLGTHRREPHANRLPSHDLPSFAPGGAVPGLSSWFLERKLGGGGFGEVWLARHAWNDREPPRAVKFCTDPNVRHRLVTHEKNVVLRVMKYAGGHPNIVPLLECNLDGDFPWLMYEYVEGGTLANHIEQWRARPTSERLAWAVETLHAIAGGLAVCHRLDPPLVHRDMKPHNVLMARGGIPRVTDFGLGSVVPPVSGATMTGLPLSARLPSLLHSAGTPIYASPEQLFGAPPSPRDDVYAMGVLTYQMLVGDLSSAPGSDALDEMRELAVPEPLVLLVARSVSRRPERRPADAGEWAEQLARLSSDKP